MKPYLPTQLDAIRAAISGDYRQLYIAAGYRTGKTYVLSHIFAMLVNDAPAHAEFGIVGRTQGAITRNVIPYLRELGRHYPEYGMKMSRIDGSPVLSINGRRCWIFGGNTDRHEDNIAGATWQGVLCDEIPRLRELVFKQAVARCSEPGAFVLGSLNKTSPHGWFKTQFWDRADEINACRLEMHLRDNVYIDAETRAHYDSLFTGHYKRRLIDNEWAEAAGAVYTDYEVVETAPACREYYAGVDWGPAGVTAALIFGRHHSGDWYIVNEYYHDGRDAGRLSEAAHVRGIQKLGYNVSRLAVDPSAITLIDAFRAAGMKTVAAHNDINPGVIAVDYNLRQRKLRIARRCERTLAEIDSYVWNTQEDKPQKGNDHAMDAMRYAVAQWLPVRSLAPREMRGF